MRHFLGLTVLLLTCSATSAMAQERPRTRIIILAETRCHLSVWRSPPVFLFVARSHPGHELAALREDFTPEVVRDAQSTQF